MAYIPMQGLAGTMSFELYDRNNFFYDTWEHSLLGIVTLNVFDFKQSGDVSSEEFENIGRTIMDDFFGERQIIEFSLVNTDATINANLLSDIVILYEMINLVRTNREIYRLKILYRYPADVAISDAIFVGSLLNIEELSATSNSAQKIPMQFKSRTLTQNIVIDQSVPGSTYVTDDEIYSTTE